MSVKTSIFKPNKNYTFSDYFEINYPTKEILAAFEYDYDFEVLTLPEYSTNFDALDRLRNVYLTKLPLISLNSEISRRDFYIAPFLLELLEYIRAEINVEYPIDAGQNLSGSVDYLVKSVNNLIIIEAKKGDLERGFNQLAVELIALDKTLDDRLDTLYGTVTLGDVWRFGRLQRSSKLLSKDMNIYALPEDIERLLAIMLGILQLESGKVDKEVENP